MAADPDWRDRSRWVLYTLIGNEIARTQGRQSIIEEAENYATTHRVEFRDNWKELNDASATWIALTWIGEYSCPLRIAPEFYFDRRSAYERATQTPAKRILDVAQ
jgi:hypothetical protein